MKFSRFVLPFGSTASVLAIAVAMPTAANAQNNAEDCTVYTDQQQRDDCVERVRDNNPIAASGDAATLSPNLAESEGGGESQAIVVTGSRIRRSEFNSPDPIQIINPELELRKGAISTAEIIQSSPLASGSTQITSAISSNFVTDGGTGTETINLRGLGASRTLTLLNGRRAGPAGTRGAVSSFDLNVLPASVIQSVEILKTGASSIYGSDAIAGVVNLITKTKTNGIELGGFASVPEGGAAESYNVNLAWGKEFAGGGHILIAGDYFKRNELALNDRDYLACTEDFIFRRDGTRVDVVDPRTNEPRCSGTLGPIIRVFDYQNDVAGALGTSTPSNLPLGRATVDFQYGPGRYLTPIADPINRFQFGTPSGLFPVAYNTATQGVYNLQPGLANYDSVIPSAERYTAYIDGAYNITPDIELYAEGIYNKRKNYVNSSRQLFPQQFTSNTLLAQLFGYCDDCMGDPINTGFTGDVLLQPVIVTDHFDSHTDVDYYRGVLGVRGDIGFLPSWYFDAYGQYSKSDGSYTSEIIFQDAFDVANLRTEACAGTLTAIRGVPCVDINYTSPRVLAGNFTPEEEAFLFGTDTGRTLYDQYTAEVNFSGDLFRLPFGTVKAAVGGQFRRDEIEDTPGPATLAGNSYGLTSAGVTAGYTRSLEAYGEVEIPLLRDLTFIRDLTLSGAGRVTNVYAERASDGFSSESNGNWTYKVGLNWAVTDWLRFRGSYGTSYRAPALYEQFLANQTGFLPQLNIDPCLNLQTRLSEGSVSQRVADNCVADGVPLNYTGGGGSSALVTSGGGIGFLEPETSTAKTASIVLTPKFNLWDGLRVNLAVDYFDIKVKGEVSQLGAGSIISGCYNSDFFPDEPLCNNFTRINDPQDPRDNQIDTIADSFLNINSQVNKGFDVTASVIQDTTSFGTFSLLAQMTWQAVDRFKLFADTSQDYNGEAGDPIWTGNFTAQWAANDSTSVLYGLNVVGGTSDSERVARSGGICVLSTIRGGVAGDPSTFICPDLRLDPTFYHSVSITQRVNDEFSFTFGVSNLLDTKPPRVSTVGSGLSTFGQAPVASQYDYVGRRFFVNVRSNF